MGFDSNPAETGWTKRSQTHRNIRTARADISVYQHAAIHESRQEICHAAGPLTFFLRWGDERPLVRGSENNLDVMIGTPGLPARKWSNPVFAPVATSEVPADVHPVARLEFPHKNASQPPIKLEVVLNRRC